MNAPEHEQRIAASTLIDLVYRGTSDHVRVIKGAADTGS